MKRVEKRIKRRILSMMMAMAMVLSVATAWATVSYVKPEDVNVTMERASKADIPEEVAAEQKSRAPEPSTLVLFGGGFFGMVMSLIRRTYAMMKRVFDVMGAILGMIILSPLFLMTYLLVKLTSKGPAIYSQIRVGQFGKEFRIYKFRSMRVDAEKNGAVWAKKNDDRMTPVGNFLRKAHLDEIPQLYNVLKGEMSIIGPRPERPVFVDQFKKEINDYEGRLEVKPGITGLAQVWHRYDTSIEDVKKKLKYDLLYIKKMCFWSDFNIMLRTFRVVVTGEGAH